MTVTNNKARSAKRGASFGMAATIIALGTALLTGGAANAATGTVSPSSGSVSGGTQTTISIPMLSGDIYSTGSALGTVYLGEDGNVYLRNGTMLNAPAGVTFTQVSGALDTGAGALMVGAIATDGTPYFSYGSSTFTHSSNLPASTSTVNGIWFLGDDGQVYGGGGAHIAAPAGVSFTSISASQNPVTGTWLIAGVTADGSAYVSESMGAFSEVPVTDAKESAIGAAFLSSDGDIYSRNGVKMAAPAGVKFKELTGTINAGNQAWMLGAIATDGTPYSSYNSGEFTKNSTLASAESSASGMFFLGTDGQVYSGSGVKVAAPAGVSFKSISASVHPVSGAWEVGGIATDGKSYTSEALNAFTKVSTGQAEAVAGVTFGGAAAPSTSQNGTNVTAVTPSHAEGQVDVVVTTASGKSFTLDDAFTFTADEIPGKPDAVTDLQIAGPDESGAYILSGMGSADGEVTVKDADGNIVGTATPAADGTWSVTIPESTKAPLSITQTVNGVTSDAVMFNEAPLPVVSLGVAALALGTAGGAGAWGIRRRRNA